MTTHIFSVSLAISLGMPSILLADQQDSYRDPQDGKLHGEIQSSFSKQPTGWVWKLNVTSTGHAVQPSGDWRHRAGRNRHTANEMEFLSSISGGLVLRIKDQSGKQISLTPITAGQRHRWLGRGKSADGTLLYHQLLPKPMLELTHAATEPLTPGKYQAELLARDEVRLRAHLEVTKEKATVTRLEMLGHSIAIPEERFYIKDTPEIPAVKPCDDWQERDTLGKWMVYRKIPQANKGGAIAWLFKQKDYAFLEYLTLHNTRLFQGKLCSQLRDANAPQWVRLTVRCSLRPAGHSGMHAQTILGSDKHAPEFLWWAEKYPKAAAHLVTVIGQLKQKGVKPRENKSLLPPINDSAYIKPLSFSGKLETFTGKKSTAGKHYITEVIRSIDYASTNRLWRTPEASKQHAALLSSPHWQVQQAACFGYARYDYPGVNMDRLWKLSNNEKADQRVRNAALLGYSYGDHNQAYIDMLLIVENPAHPLWETAASRLGDLDFGYAINGIDPSKFSDKQKAFWALEKKQIQSRTERIEPSQYQVNRLIMTEAWSSSLGYPQHEKLKKFLRQKVFQHKNAQAEAQKILGYIDNYQFASSKRVPKATYETIRQSIKATAKNLADGGGP